MGISCPTSRRTTSQLPSSHFHRWHLMKATGWRVVRILTVKQPTHWPEKPDASVDTTDSFFVLSCLKVKGRYPGDRSRNVVPMLKKLQIPEVLPKLHWVSHIALGHVLMRRHTGQSKNSSWQQLKSLRIDARAEQKQSDQDGDQGTGTELLENRGDAPEQSWSEPAKNYGNMTFLGIFLIN